MHNKHSLHTHTTHNTHLHLRQGIESRARTNRIIAEFRRNLEQAWKEKWPFNSQPPDVSIEGFMSQGHIAQRLSEKDLEEKGRK